LHSSHNAGTSLSTFYENAEQGFYDDVPSLLQAFSNAKHCSGVAWASPSDSKHLCQRSCVRKALETLRNSHFAVSLTLFEGRQALCKSNFQSRFNPACFSPYLRNQSLILRSLPTLTSPTPIIIMHLDLYSHALLPGTGSQIPAVSSPDQAPLTHQTMLPTCLSSLPARLLRNPYETRPRSQGPQIPNCRAERKSLSASLI